MEDRKALPLLVKDSELAVKFYKERVTIHRRGHRTQAEYWYRSKLLGSGGGGQVWLQQEIEQNGTRKANFRAVKRIAANAGAVKDYIEELNAIAKFSQTKYRDYFVESYGWYEGPQALYIAMEYCPRGDLQTYLHEHRRLSETEAQAVMLQVLTGLQHMHDEHFAHRDLKPANILVISHPPDNEWIVKLGDFGLTKRTTQIVSTMARGTGIFMPPELRRSSRNKVDHFLVDMWCLGATAYLLLTGTHCFEGDWELDTYIKDDTAFPVDVLAKHEASEDSINFIRGLMKVLPTERPSPEEALNWKWLFHSMGSPQLPDDISESPPPSPIPDLDDPTGHWTTFIGQDNEQTARPGSPKSDRKAACTDSETLLAEPVVVEPPIEAATDTTVQGLTPDLPSAMWASDHLLPTAPSPTPSAKTRVNDDDEAGIPNEDTTRTASNIQTVDAHNSHNAPEPGPSDQFASMHINPDATQVPANVVQAEGPADTWDIYRASWLYPGAFDLTKQVQFENYLNEHAKLLDPWPSIRDLEKYHEGAPVPVNLRDFLQGKAGSLGNGFETCQLSGCESSVSVAFANLCPGCGKRYCVRHRDGQYHDCINARENFETVVDDRGLNKEVVNAGDGTNSSGHQTDASRHIDTELGTEILLPKRGEPWAKFSTIELRRWDHPNAKRKRPKFAPIVRKVDSRVGELRIERWRGEGSEDSTVIGFKTKVVSRTHGRIVCFQGQWFIQDTGSASGTWLNNIRLSAADEQSDLKPLTEGDLVQLGVDYSGASNEDIYGCVFFRIHFPSQKEPIDENEVSVRGAEADSETITVVHAPQTRRLQEEDHLNQSVLTPGGAKPLSRPAGSFSDESAVHEPLHSLSRNESHTLIADEPKVRLPRRSKSSGPERIRKETKQNSSDPQLGRIGQQSDTVKTTLPHIDDILPPRFTDERDFSIPKLLTMAESSFIHAEFRREFNRIGLALEEFFKASAIMLELITEHPEFRGGKFVGKDLSSQYYTLLAKIKAKNQDYVDIMNQIIEDNKSSGTQPKFARASSKKRQCALLQPSKYPGRSHGAKKPTLDETPSSFEGRDRKGRPLRIPAKVWRKMQNQRPDDDEVRHLFVTLLNKEDAITDIGASSYSLDVMWSMVYDDEDIMADFELEREVSQKHDVWKDPQYLTGSEADDDLNPRAPPESRQFLQDRFDLETLSKPRGSHRRSQTDDVLHRTGFMGRLFGSKQPSENGSGTSAGDENTKATVSPPSVASKAIGLADKISMEDFDNVVKLAKPQNDETTEFLFEQLMTEREWTSLTGRETSRLRACSTDQKWALIYYYLKEVQHEGKRLGDNKIYAFMRTDVVYVATDMDRRRWPANTSMRDRLKGALGFQ